MIRFIAMAALAMMAATSALADTAAGTNVPQSKRTVLGKYVSSKEAHDAAMAERPRLLFIDVRSSAELMFVGVADDIDAQVPFAELAEPRAWDDKGGRFAMSPNPAFVANVEAALARKGLSKSDKVLVICRSGERSARAVDMLAKAGFTNAWSVYDGFEGDLSKEGHRTVNGWKNAGLPWSYKLDKSKLQANVPMAQR
ncbi:rhodanese-like domain-containing protein [Hyphomicrobium zavarzinii]|uniref:rhodanese-like domain-containing protein n=1 Tax=Hyphomicrobium zavarzinii TaxID=48292 RepID=UPI00047EDEDC|nr:rhodanese-like domain-containing protein [Hyphomicrobium zavarzinii]